ncbi:hypothetical protein D3C87_1992020 [compost metagenome]
MPTRSGEKPGIFKIPFSSSSITWSAASRSLAFIKVKKKSSRKSLSKAVIPTGSNGFRVT